MDWWVNDLKSSPLDSINRLIDKRSMTSDTPATGTRLNLIRSGLRLFGQRGYEATSTRALAEHAGTNVASIAYHFGGKAGLRLACAEYLAGQVGAVIMAAEAGQVPSDPVAAMAEIDAAIHSFARLLLVPSETGDFVPFVIRELTEPGEIAEMLFSQFFLPRHSRFCRLWSVVTGKPAEADDVMLTVFAAIGQVLYFRIARPFVIRRMGWQALDAAEAGLIADTIVANLRAIAERTRS